MRPEIFRDEFRNVTEGTNLENIMLVTENNFGKET